MTAQPERPCSDVRWAELAERRWITLPGDDRQHRSGADCPCGPVQHPSGAVDHR